MKRWLHRLHGGQLVMLLLTVGAISFLVAGTGYNFLQDSTRDYELASLVRRGDRLIRPDSAGALVFEKQADQENRIGFRIFLSGLAIGLMGIWMLWSWLGARRRAP